LGNIIDQSNETWDQQAHSFATEFPYIEISAIELGTGDYTVEMVPIEEAPSRAKMIVHTNDIIISTTRPHRGAVAIIKPEHDGYIASTGFTVLRSLKSNNVTRPFLLYTLLSSPVLRQFLQRSSGGNYPAIVPDEIDKVIIPTPPTADQEQFVDELNSANSIRRRHIQDADSLFASLDQFILSSLHLPTTDIPKPKVFALPLSSLSDALNPERYQFRSVEKSINGTTMSTVADIVESKSSPSKLSPDKQWDWIRIDDLSNQPLSVETIRTELGSDIDGTFYQVQENDILLARLGPTIQNAKFVLCPKLERQTVASSEFYVLRFRKGWNPLVVLWVLRTKLYRDLMYSKGRGGTPSRYRLSREDLAALPFPNISQKLQGELAAEISNRLAEIKRLRDEADKEWSTAKQSFEQKLLGVPG
ncbi:MAG: hypothetical protein FJ045_03575, partial [Crenarchaeota archaeon]|nr:hypothetical protein [Thermoproteota archaeon]